MSSLARYCRKIVVGDVSGCFDELMLLLNRLKHDPARDELYFVGDLVAKGPKTNDVIEFVRNTEKTYSVMGNHEYETLRVAQALNKLGPKVKMPIFDFSRYTPSNPLEMRMHVECAKSLSPLNMSYLTSLPLSVAPHPKIRVVHAGVIPNVAISKQNPWILLNIRNAIEKPTPKHSTPNVVEGTAYHDLGEAWVNLYHGPEHIFFGHDAKRRLQIAAYATGLDTGCVYGGSLTAAIIKCDEQNNLINELETEYEEEAWEYESSRYVNAFGLVYRLMHQRGKKMYQNPYIDDAYLDPV